jgi:tellurite resistance-related uncharacterized protein
MSLALSTAKGSLLGGQPITLTGDAFGATAGTVTIEGRACEVVSWSAGSIQILTPPRLTAGLLVLEVTLDDNGDIAPIHDALVVTLADAVTTFSADYTYLVTRWDIALQGVRAVLATISLAAGDNYDIGPDQIRDYQIGEDGSSRGGSFPQLTVYGGTIDYTFPDQPYEHDTGEMVFIVAAVTPVSHPENWDAELRALGRDLAAKIRRARLSSKVAHQIAVTSINPQAKPKDGQVTGAMGTVVVEGKIHLEHLSIDMNTNTGA